MLQVAFKFAQTKMWQTLCAWKSNESDPIPSPFFPQPGSSLVVTDRLLGENIQHGCWQAGEVSVSQLNQVWPNSAEGPYLNTYKYFVCTWSTRSSGQRSPELCKDNFKIYLGDFFNKNPAPPSSVDLISIKAQRAVKRWPIEVMVGSAVQLVNALIIRINHLSPHRLFTAPCPAWRWETIWHQPEQILRLNARLPPSLLSWQKIQNVTQKQEKQQNSLIQKSSRNRKNNKIPLIQESSRNRKKNNKIPFILKASM